MIVIQIMFQSSDQNLFTLKSLFSVQIFILNPLTRVLIMFSCKVVGQLNQRCSLKKWFMKIETNCTGEIPILYDFDTDNVSI